MSPPGSQRASPAADAGAPLTVTARSADELSDSANPVDADLRELDATISQQHGHLDGA